VLHFVGPISPCKMKHCSAVIEAKLRPLVVEFLNKGYIDTQALAGSWSLAFTLERFSEVLEDC